MYLQLQYTVRSSMTANRIERIAINVYYLSGFCRCQHSAIKFSFYAVFIRVRTETYERTIDKIAFVYIIIITLYSDIEQIYQSNYLKPQLVWIIDSLL